MKIRFLALGILLEILYLGFYLIKFLQNKWGIEKDYLNNPTIYIVTFIILGLALIIQIASALIIFKKNINIKYIFIFSIIFNLSLLFVWNIGSDDLYTHIQRGRMVVKYDASPYDQIYDNYKYDSFYEETRTVWSGQLSIYGPAFTIFGAVISKIAQDSLVAHILIYKLIYSILNFLTGFLIYKITKNALSTMLFAWNPIVIFEIQANNHFEILTVFPLVLSIFLLLSKKDFKRYIFSLSILTMGVMTKYVSIIAYPFFIIYILKNLKTLKTKIIFLVLGGGTQLIILGLLYLPFLDSGINLKGFFELANGKFISPSLGILFFYNLMEQYGFNKHLAQGIIQNIFKAFYLFLGIKSLLVSKFADEREFVKILVYIFTGFTFLYLNLVLPWYTLSLLALVAVYYGISKNTKYLYLSYLLTLYSFLIYIRFK